MRATVSDPGYAVDTSVELVIDPEKRGYPTTPEERDKLQRSLIHFQISNYVAADTPLDEAKQRLIQRYERRLKQLIDVPPAEINAGFLDSFAASLDPHSNYLSADVLEDFRISMTLSLEGIGVALAERDGYAVVGADHPGRRRRSAEGAQAQGQDHRGRRKRTGSRSTSSTCRCATPWR